MSLAPPRPANPPSAPHHRHAGRDRLVLQVEPEQSRRMLLASLSALGEQDPESSAEETFSRDQKRFAAVLGVLVLLGLGLAPRGTGVALMALVTLTYSAAVTYRIACFVKGLRGQSLVRISDEAARAVPAELLPVYTVLIPAYREPEVIGHLLEHVDALDYPRDRLEVLVLLEEDDPETLEAMRQARPWPHIKVVVVPTSELKTKPKACNYGLQLATGELVTIYDAEDRPEPLQLRRAACAFASLPPDVVCLQAQLGYYNAGQNRITGWFTAEYLTWFAHFLPGLVALGAPVPLGGTSNHIRASVLRAVGAWDPFNVTEDADLGMRLHRRGMRTAVLDSLTLEEANSDFVNWAKQRSRWYKGYVQTWLVHLRHPVVLYRELGPRGFLGFNLFIGGTPLLSVLNPFFWTMTLVYFLGRLSSGAGAFPAQQIEALFPAPWYYLALLCFVAGNLSILYMGVVSMREAGREDLVLSALTVPVYWVMMSVAGIKAVVQLLRQPSFWEKTTHGLYRAPRAEGEPAGQTPTGPDLPVRRRPAHHLVARRARPVEPVGPAMTRGQAGPTLRGPRG